MTLSKTEVFDQICELMAPFNLRSIPLKKETSFASDLELDSLAVMDMLAALEDHFDVTVPLNILPDLENIGQVAEAIKTILDE
jgi:acyl carrier protein